MDVQTPAASVERALAPGADTLYVFFGGIAAGIAMPPFEFYRAAGIITEHKIFVRDFDQCWYHAGLRGHSHDLRSTVRFLRAELDAVGARRVVFVGNSMGGYAAMLFAALLGVGEVIAFAPQTFVSPWLRLRHGDRRWPRQIARMWRRGALHHHVWDLRPQLARCAGRVRVALFYSPDDHLDSVHAWHVAGIQGVELHAIASGGHDLVRGLRDQGRLPAIMQGGSGA